MVYIEGAATRRADENVQSNIRATSGLTCPRQRCVYRHYVFGWMKTNAQTAKAEIDTLACGQEGELLKVGCAEHESRRRVA